jgi:hypothetical protein
MKCELCGRDNLTAKELAVHRRYFHSKQAITQQPGEARIKAQIVTANVCPDCGGQLVMQEGCEHCNRCGYSKCG